VTKLERFVRLSADDVAALEKAARQRVRKIRAHEDIVRENSHPRVVNLILSGWACRYKYLVDGRRQIIAILVPGDLCDLNVFILREMDHAIGTITNVTLAEIAPVMLEEITLWHPRVTQALWWETLVAAAIQREWTVNLGQRTALERVAHLLCELMLRLRAVDLTEGDSCEWPLTQAELADTTGLSPVHVNRTLQELRTSGLVTLKGKTLTINDFEALANLAMFNRNYLHLDHEGGHLDANQ
jgi:CRP-like cAMP-binding protein